MADSGLYGSQTPSFIPVIPDIDFAFTKAVKGQPDAIETVITHHEARFDAANASAIASLKREAAELDEQYEFARKQLRKIETDLMGTAQWIDCNLGPDGEGPQDVAIVDWHTMDKISALLFALLAALLILLGMVTVYVNVQGSGIPAFLENPWLAWLFAAIVPATSGGLKSVYHLFGRDLSRKLYAALISILAALAGVSWIVLFVQQFHGVGSGIDLTAILNGETGDSGSGFVASQLAAEVLGSATLVIAIERLFAKYSRTCRRLNPFWESLTKAYDEKAVGLDKVSQRRNAVHNAFAAFEPARIAYVGEAVAIFRAQH